MIPADHITIDGDTAWWVLMPIDKLQLAADEADADRPCDTCQGDGSVPVGPNGIAMRWDRCPDCIDGRHTFGIEVECKGALVRSEKGGFICNGGCQMPPYGVLTHRVSIVPDMVLPIVENSDDLPDTPALIELYPLGDAFYWPEGADDHAQAVSIILPPAAKPGMWAVQLKIASEGGGAVVGEVDSNHPTVEGNVSRNPTDPYPQVGDS